MKKLLPLLTATFALAVLAAPAIATADEATDLADAVIQASGGAKWPEVKRLQFTFWAKQPGKDEPLMKATHDWDIAGNKDTVTWTGKTVTIDLGAANDSGDDKAAFARWTNDSYWLLAPLKLRDKGAHLAYGGKQTKEGKEYEVLNVSFDKVGLTNGDKYNIYVDPSTHLIAFWDYMPAPDKKFLCTWEKYEPVGGLTLSTDHDFGGKKIQFSDIKVD